jgi:phosphonate transport system substrate-binding protein
MGERRESLQSASMSKWRFAWGIAGALGLLLIQGCDGGESPSGAEKPNEALRLALVPSEDAERMTEGFEPIRKKLAEDIGREVKMVSVTDYTSVIEAMRGGKVDVAWYGPLSVVLAKEQAGADPFVIADIEGKGVTYRSFLIVHAESPAKSIADLKGMNLALVDPASTSGNLVPRSDILDATGQTVEKYFAKATYAGSHDAALIALIGRSVDVCAIQDVTFEDAVKRGDIKREDYRIVHESAEIPQSPLAFRKDLDADLKASIRKSFLGMKEGELNMDVPGMGKVRGFVATDYGKYQPIEKMAKNLGLSHEQMAK